MNASEAIIELLYINSIEQPLIKWDRTKKIAIMTGLCFLLKDIRYNKMRHGHIL